MQEWLAFALNNSDAKEGHNPSMVVNWGMLVPARGMFTSKAYPTFLDRRSFFEMVIVCTTFLSS
jgi:hypothetical protein